MNNCLVTKLKSSVNNESLSKLNVLTIKTKASDSPTLDTQLIVFKVSSNGSASINSTNVGLYKSGISGELLPYPQTLLANNGINSHFENKDGIIEVAGKYDLIIIAAGKNAIFRAKEIYGIPGTIEQLSMKNIEEGEVDATKLSKALDLGKLKYFELPTEGNLVTVNIVNRLSKNTLGEVKTLLDLNDSFCSLFDNSIGLDDIANNVSLTSINFSSLKAGNLSSLSKLTNLTTIIFQDPNQNNGDIMIWVLEYNCC